MSTQITPGRNRETAEDPRAGEAAASSGSPLSVPTMDIGPETKLQ
jgi:hypothetical protein